MHCLPPISPQQICSDLSLVFITRESRARKGDQREVGRTEHLFHWQELKLNKNETFTIIVKSTAQTLFCDSSLEWLIQL
jgi:hypothetical protein